MVAVPYYLGGNAWHCCTHKGQQREEGRIEGKRKKKREQRAAIRRIKNEEDEKDKRMDQSGKKRVTKVKEENEGKGRAEGGSVMLDESCAYWAVGTV